MTLAEFRNRPAYPVVYMFVVMFCFTAVLVGLARSAADRVEANRQIMFEKAVLLALGIEVGGLSSSAVHEKFLGTVNPPTPESFGAYTSDEGYAVPFAGQGFWNTIRGIVGVRHDGRTLTGIAFYEQSETPGLGAEIVKPRFRDQFKGVVLVDGPAPVQLRPGGAEAEPGAVHAVTGATQTCTRLEKILNDALRTWRDHRKQ